MTSESSNCPSGVHLHDARLPNDERLKRLMAALGLTTCFMLVEFVGGWFSSSLALMSDAVHMLTDAFAIFVGIVTIWISTRAGRTGGTDRFRLRKAETVGALVSGLGIFVLVGYLVVEATGRFFNPVPVNAPVLLSVAVLGLVVNLLVARILHPAAAGSLGVRAAYLHVLGDLLGSLGAVVAGTVIILTGWMLVDPLVTYLIAVLISVNAGRLVRDCLVDLGKS